MAHTVVIAPDSFKGTIAAAAAARAIAEGWRRERPADDLRELPMADGGEGTDRPRGTDDTDPGDGGVHGWVRG